MTADDLVEDLAEVHDCHAGWLEDGHDDRPRPCLLCRPWLARQTARTTCEEQQ